MQIRKVCFIVFLWMIASSIQASSYEDSLQKLLKSNITDTTRINTLNCMCLEKSNGNVKEGFAYCKQALGLAQNKRFYKGIITAYRYFSALEKNLGNYDRATQYADSGLAICDKQKMEIEKIKILNQKGNISGDLGNSDKALMFYLEAAGLVEKYQQKKSLTTLYGNIGICFLAIKQYAKCKEYYNKGIKMCIEENDMRNLGSSYDNLAGVYIETGQIDSGLYYFKKCEEIYIKIGYKKGLGFNAYYAGYAYLQLKDYDKALTSFLKAESIYRETSNLAELPNILICVAETYVRLNMFDKALDYAFQSLKQATENKSDNDKKEAFKILKDIYCTKADYKTALDYYGKYVAIKDSLLNTESSKQMADMQTKYETDKKETENKLLQETNKVSLKTIQQQQYIAVAIGVICLLIIVFAINIYRASRLRHKANIELARKNNLIEQQKKEVEHQKEIVDEKQKEILDSIHYAKRIQHAVITSDNYISEHLKDYFIYYQPKDIVSGDFYWALAGEHNTFYIAACDCTGHGVPGAFMSLLNISILNEVMIEKKITQPDLILNEARKDIIKALNPTGTENAKDGMDCILCCFDFEKLQLRYASANNSFYIVRNNELIICWADKMPVGKSPKDTEPFTLHTVELQKGDIVYTLTDGLPDQFGGPKGKKFKYKQLEDILLENCKLTMQEQKDTLHKRFEEWRGDLEQVDDVLIIGVHV